MNNKSQYNKKITTTRTTTTATTTFSRRAVAMKRPWGCGRQERQPQRVTVEVDIPDGCCNNIQVNVKAGKVTVTADRGGMGMSSGDSATCSPAAARLPSSPESSSSAKTKAVEKEPCAKKLDFDTKAVKKEPCAKKLDFDEREASGPDKVRGFLQAHRAQHVRPSDEPSHVQPSVPKQALVPAASNASQIARAARESSFAPPPPLD